MTGKKQAMIRILPGAILLMNVLLAATAGAARAGEEDLFRVSGFATAGIVFTDTDDAHYATAGQVRGATRSVSSEVDSKLAVQVDSRLTPVFSATLQLMSRADGDGNWEPEVEWAFLKAQLTPEFAIRMGRMGAPVFAISDYRHVGYANLWVRPPLEVYGQILYSQFDGVDLDYQRTLGPALLNVQLFGGTIRDYANKTKTKLYDMKGFNTRLAFDNGISLRLGLMKGHSNIYSVMLNQLTDGLRSVPIQAVQQLGETLDPRGFKSSYQGFAIDYDRGDWIANFELAERKTNSLASDTSGWYASVGHRFGPFTPYVTYGHVRLKDHNFTNVVPTGISPGLDALHGGVEYLRTVGNIGQKTPGLGVRWDVARNIAVKAQYERANPDTAGMFLRASPEFTGSPVDVFSLCIDTVF